MPSHSDDVRRDEDTIDPPGVRCLCRDRLKFKFYSSGKKKRNTFLKRFTRTSPSHLRAYAPHASYYYYTITRTRIIKNKSQSLNSTYESPSMVHTITHDCTEVTRENGGIISHALS